MLDLSKVNEVANQAASAILKRQAGAQRVLSEPASDTQGHEALHITIVLSAAVLARSAETRPWTRWSE
jgi:hypothetical protein